MGGVLAELSWPELLLLGRDLGLAEPTAECFQRPTQLHSDWTTDGQPLPSSPLFRASRRQQKPKTDRLVTPQQIISNFFTSDLMINFKRLNLLFG